MLIKQFCVSNFIIIFLLRVTYGTFSGNTKHTQTRSLVTILFNLMKSTFVESQHEYSSVLWNDYHAVVSNVLLIGVDAIFNNFSRIVVAVSGEKVLGKLYFVNIKQKLLNRLFDKSRWCDILGKASPNNFSEI